MIKNCFDFIKNRSISGIFQAGILNPDHMFHTIITLAYIIPNIYVFLRFRQLFVNKGYKLYYSLIYILIALIYPFVSLFSGGDSAFVNGTLGPMVMYILPFYLYLFLFVLLFDLFLLVNRLFKIVSGEKMRSKGFKIYSLSVILLLSLGVVVAGAINFNTIRISEYQINIPRKSAKIKKLKIAFVADFHLKRRTNLHFVEKFAKEIAVIQPDLMIFGGDIVEGDNDDESMRRFEQIFREIHPRYGVFAVLGNHEFYGEQEKGHFFDQSGMKLLCDSTTVIDSSFNLAGRYDSHFSRRKSIGELMKSVNDSLPVILIDHRPSEIEQVSKTTVDIQLSGHTHNGQLFPLNLILSRMYQLSWGYKKIVNTHFFVTSGIRLWGPLVRTTGKSEIMVIDVTFRGKL